MDTTYLKMTAPILSSFDSFLGYIALEPPSWINQCRLAAVPLVACAWGSGTVYLYVGSRGQEVTVFWWATISLTFIISAKTIVILASSNTLDRTRHFPEERCSLLAFTSPGFGTVTQSLQSRRSICRILLNCLATYPCWSLSQPRNRVPLFSSKATPSLGIHEQRYTLLMNNHPIFDHTIKLKQY